MHNSKHIKTLPWLSLAGIILMGCSSLILPAKRAELLKEDPAVRIQVEGYLEGVSGLIPESANDPNLMEFARSLSKQENVSCVWLLAPDGRVVLSEGSTAFTENAFERVPASFQRILNTLPKDSLDADQINWLKAAAAIQAEGEHNDIYRHLLQPVLDAGGKTAAMLGVAYDLNLAVSAPGLAYQLGLLLFAAGLGLYWLSLPIWVYLDARQRGEKAFIWGLFILVGNLVALLAYLLVRKSGKPLME